MNRAPPPILKSRASTVVEERLQDLSRFRIPEEMNGACDPAVPFLSVRTGHAQIRTPLRLSIGLLVRLKLPFSKFCQGVALLAECGSPFRLRFHFDIQFSLATFAFDVTFHDPNLRSTAGLVGAVQKIGTNVNGAMSAVWTDARSLVENLWFRRKV
jgi:hypothetical protein